MSKSCIKRLGPISGSTILLDSEGIPWTNDVINVLGIDIAEKELVTERNINPVVEKMQRTLKTWESRDLTLIGKITVINTLVMSLLVYRLSVIPTLAQNIVQSVNKIWSQFIWNKRKPKISWEILTSPKRNGGLSLAHITKRDMALKIQWVQRIFSDSFFMRYSNKILNTILNENIWKCNLQPRDLKYVTQGTGFWFDVLKAWSHFNFIDPLTRQQIKNQYLWFNSNLRISNKPFIIENMYHAGIETVSQLLNDDCTFLSIAQFKQKFPTISFLEYLSVIKAFPSNWKKWLLNDVHAKHQPEPPRLPMLEQHNIRV